MARRPIPPFVHVEPATPFVARVQVPHPKVSQRPVLHCVCHWNVSSIRKLEIRRLLAVIVEHGRNATQYSFRLLNDRRWVRNYSWATMSTAHVLPKSTQGYTPTRIASGFESRTRLVEVKRHGHALIQGGSGGFGATRHNLNDSPPPTTSMSSGTARQCRPNHSRPDHAKRTHVHRWW